MSDEGFHEIQLNGKQLVFLFMAATVVSVVIFLLGVMVGRGARPHQAAAAVGEVGPTPAVVEEAPRTEQAASPPPPSSQTPAPAGAPAVTPPVPAEGAAGYFDDLTKSQPGKAEKVAPVEPEKRAEAPAPPPPKPADAPSPSAAVTSGGFAVQIAALRDRSEADAIVKRLTGKGYQAFVLNPIPGKPPVYRVQVGRFADRGEAEKVAARLKAEEQFSPWVTR